MFFQLRKPIFETSHPGILGHDAASELRYRYRTMKYSSLSHIDLNAISQPSIFNIWCNHFYCHSSLHTRVTVAIPMMASSSNAIPLHVEFETIIRYIQEEHTCIAKVPFLPKCRNKLSKKSGRRIIQLLEGFVLAIQRGECLDKDLLTEASSLLMCNRRHQGLAALQLEDWCERKESVDAIVEHSPETLEV